MKSRKTTFTNTIIVLGTIGLAVAPVVADQFHTEVARWYLAEATNRVGSDSDTNRQVEQARRWAGDVTRLRDYWIFRAEQALASSPKEVSTVIAKAVEANKANYFLAESYGERLANGRFFAEAAAVLKAGLIPEIADDSLRLNNLAYYRALAGIDLDQALTDVDLVLSRDPNLGIVRDTRAWILFQMGKPQLALEDANFAVEQLAAKTDVEWFDHPLLWLEENMLAPPPVKADLKILTRREAGEQLWGAGTQYYHRARILEALGRADEAKKDFQWLSDHSLPTDDRLF